MRKYLVLLLMVLTVFQSVFIYSTEKAGANNAPVISSTPLTIAEEGSDYSYDVNVSDLTKDGLSFSLIKSAAGMKINKRTGLITWTPAKTQAGSYEIEVEVEDNQGEKAMQSFSLDVAEGINNDPQIISKPVLEGEEKEEYSYDLEAEDNDQQQIIFKLVEAPQGMTIDQATGVITWEPTGSQSDDYQVKVKAIDGRGGSDTQSYTLAIKETINQAPVITSQPLTRGEEGKKYSYDLKASDINHDSLNYELIEAPLEMKIDSNTGLITWLPDGTQAGSYEIKVKVSDGKGGAASQKFELKIAEAINTAPKITSTPDTNGKEGEEFSYDLKAEDADGDPLSYSLVTKPQGMKIDSSKGIVTWTPDSTQGGSHEVEVKVTDDRGGVAKQKFMITVEDTLNTDPEILSTPVKSVKEGEKYNYRLKVRDKDGDNLEVNLSGLPEGMKTEKVDGDIQLGWTPTAKQAGDYKIEITVSDKRGGKVEQNYTLTVKEAINAVPIIISPPILQTGTAGQLYSHDVDAVDAEDDTLSYSIVNPPGGMQIEETTGQINWIPKEGHVGKHNIEVQVTDSQGAVATEKAEIQIAAAANKAPKIISSPKKVARVDREYNYDVEAVDANGDLLTYSLEKKPTGMKINSDSGLITWIPNKEQKGLQEVIVAVSDKYGIQDKQKFSIAVNDSSFNLPLATDYLNKQQLFGEEILDVKTLAMLLKVYRQKGRDVTGLKAQLRSSIAEQNLIEQAYSLIALADKELAESLSVKQNSNGSWQDSIYQTALSSYGLLEADLKVSSALRGLDYLASQQAENGSWNQSLQDTALAILALERGGSYSPEVKEALNWLLIQQSGSGNWGSNTNTAWTVLALLEEGNQSEKLKEAINYLTKLINQDGGWGIYPGQKSNQFSSGLVILALESYDSTLKEIEDGLTYLDKLAADRLYLDKAFRYYNLAEINYLLKDYSAFSARNISWLIDFADQKNYDYLARQISIRAQAGKNVSDLVQKLVAAQQRNGAWSFKDGEQSNAWDTILAMRALLDAGYSDLSVYAAAGGYLQHEQKSEGSFALQSKEAGSIYLTAAAIEELERLSDRLNVSPILASSRAWLLSQRNSSGSYGNSILETARALSVLGKELSQAEIDSSLEELKKARLANGSWENDSLTTAAVIETVLKVE